MLNFLGSGVDVTDALAASYSFPLIAASYFIATMAAYTSLSLVDRFATVRTALTRYIWSAVGAVSMGAGVWAMHFIGMLAFSLSIPIQYDALITATSVIPAILAGFVMIKVISHKSIRSGHIVAGGLLMGSGIGLMHFVGMAAMRLDAMMLYEPRLFITSIIIAVMLAIVALSTRRWLDHFQLFARFRNLVAASIMGLAITAMHYIAMSSTYFFPATSHAVVESVNTEFVAGAIGVVVAVLLGLTIVAVRIGHHVGQTTAALHQGKIRFKAVVDSVADGIITIDRAGNIIDVNPGAISMFGYSTEEVLGKTVETFMREDDADTHQQRIDGYSGENKTRTRIMQREITGRRKDGSTFPVDISVTEMKIDEEIMFVGVCQDITERRQAQEALEARERDLEKQIEQRKLTEERLVIERQRADQSNQAKSEFLSRMSHELRTPMNSIIGFTGIIKDGVVGPVNEEQAKQLNMVYNSAKHLLSLINDVLDISRVEAGKLYAAEDEFDLPALLQDVYDLIKTQADAKDLDFVANFDKAPSRLYSDKARLRQILVNLLGNSVKFTSEGRIELRCEIVDDSVLIEVEDTGVGIEDAEQEDIFEAFHQIEGGDERQQEGSGLGLAITSQLIELLGCEIEVQSEPGKGSTFSVRLPADKIRGDHSLARIPRAKGATRRHRKSDSRTVLVIDDQKDALELLKNYLQQEDYDVVLCDDASNAVALAKMHQPLAITLDILMPDPDGWNTMSALKDDPETASIPIIMISSMDEKNLGLSLGAMDYLQKPVEAAELLSCLENLNLTGSNVLVIDDRPQDSEMLRAMLEPEDYQITICQDGPNGLLTLENNSYDLILLDLMMPGMSGFEFIRRLRGGDYPRGSETPIIVVSAKSLTDAETKFLNSTVENILVKGQFDREEMLAEVGRTLSRITGNTETEQVAQ